MTRIGDDGSVMTLPPYNCDERCPKCRHTDVNTSYQADTSHHACGLGQQLRTSWGPEHFTRTCQRCHYQWEQAVLGPDDLPAEHWIRLHFLEYQDVRTALAEAKGLIAVAAKFAGKRIIQGQVEVTTIKIDAALDLLRSAAFPKDDE